MSRDSFIFYRSFFEAIEDLPEEDQAAIFKAICKYSLDFKEPKLNGLSKTIWTLIKPQLKANNARYMNGTKGGKYGTMGGRPKTPKKPLDNPKETPSLTPNKNENENENDIPPNPQGESDSSTPKRQKEKKTPPSPPLYPFEDFWELYGKKTDRKRCETKWDKISDEEKAMIMKTLPAYVRSTPDLKYRKLPITYLNGENWNDEVVTKNVQQGAIPNYSVVPE